MSSETAIDKKRLLVQQRNGAGVSFLEDPVLWMGEKQRSFYGSMSKSLRQIKSQSALSAAWSLLLVSFLYGVFHAAGPGHGKAVVSAWIVANRSDLRRGLLIAFMSALIQALSAIVIVSVLMLLFSNATTLAKNSVGLLDSASFAMIACLGLYLMWTGWRGHGHDHAHDHHHVHDHHHAHDHGEGDGHSHGGSHHQHGTHVHSASCGHMHAPSPQAVRGDASLVEMLSLAFAVGVRPCSGAILVLIFAWTAGLYWAGVISALAMGVGVFMTVALIASASVYAKAWAMRFAAADNDRTERLARVLKIAGGLVIAALGTLMFLGSLGNNGGML